MEEFLAALHPQLPGIVLGQQLAAHCQRIDLSVLGKRGAASYGAYHGGSGTSALRNGP